MLIDLDDMFHLNLAVVVNPIKPLIIPRTNVRRISLFSSPSFKLSKGDLEQLTTTQLLVKLGFIRQPHAGITQWLPLGLKTLRNIEELIRKKLDDAGVLEVSLSSLSHSSLWQKTNRWANDELYKLNEDYCLAATAEEDITALVKEYAQSYKNLPLQVYQINRKYRDEKRARGGLLRGREFIMKDAYSFDVSKTEALKSFNKFNEIYLSIFQSLKIPFVKANADAGSIGGDLSYEWHFLSDKGEDTLYTCDNCGTTGNVEKIRPYVDLDAQSAPKAQVTYCLTTGGSLVVFYYPVDRKLNIRLFESLKLVHLNTKLRNQNKIVDAFRQRQQDSDGWANIIRVYDVGCGNNTLYPELPVKADTRFTTDFRCLDITDVQENDLCPACGGGGHLHSSKGIEVGHTFYLGKKYSIPLDAKFSDKNGRMHYYDMGCYGIGVSRLLGSIAEVLRDDKGLRWPATIAPFHVSLIRAGKNADRSVDREQKVEELVQKLHNRHIEVSIGDENFTFAQNMNVSKALGIPLQVIVGRSYPMLEIEIRGNVSGEIGKKQLEERAGELGISHTERNGFEKYLVNIQHADDVIDLLLRDM